MTVDVAATNQLVLGEGAIWDATYGRLYWVDIIGRRVLWLDLDGRMGSATVAHMPGTVMPYRLSHVLLATDVGFELLDTATGMLALVAAVEGDQPDRRMNDGKCDPYGRPLAGTMDLAATYGQGVLYRLDHDGTVTPVLRDLSVPNGLAWPEPDRMYYIDSPTRRIDLYHYDRDAGVGALIRSIDVSGWSGSPDGMTLDADGNLWVAFWDGAALRCFNPAGDLLHELRLPSRLVTSCAFGGPDLDTLYITTAAYGLDRPTEQDGVLLSCRGLATGRPSQPWAGNPRSLPGPYDDGQRL